MQTFYETPPGLDRGMQRAQELSYRVDFRWCSTGEGGGGEHTGRQTGEDSSFYEEDGHFEPYASEGGGAVFKGVQSDFPARVCNEEQSLNQSPVDGSYYSGGFDPVHKCPRQTNRIGSPPTVQNLNCFISIEQFPLSDSTRVVLSSSTATQKLGVIDRRNRRERFRVRAVNEAFGRLRQLVPATRCAPKRVSKRSTLLHAAAYIRELQQLILADATAPTHPPWQHKSVPPRSRVVDANAHPQPSVL